MSLAWTCCELRQFRGRHSLQIVRLLREIENLINLYTFFQIYQTIMLLLSGTKNIAC